MDSHGKGGLVVYLAIRLATLDDVALWVDEEQVADGDVTEVEAERVDPEAVLADGIAIGEVARDAFVEAKHAEYSEGGCEAFLATLSLLLEGVVGRQLGYRELPEAGLRLLLGRGLAGNGRHDVRLDWTDLN